MPDGWHYERDLSGGRDNSSGTSVIEYRHESTYEIVFVPVNDNTIAGDAWNATFGATDMARDVVDLVGDRLKQLRLADSDNEFLVAGQNVGGTAAQIVSHTYQLPGVTYNAADPGEDAASDVEYIQHVASRGEEIKGISPDFVNVLETGFSLGHASGATGAHLGKVEEANTHPLSNLLFGAAEAGVNASDAVEVVQGTRDYVDRILNGVEAVGESALRFGKLVTGLAADAALQVTGNSLHNDLEGYIAAREVLENPLLYFERNPGLKGTRLHREVEHGVNAPWNDNPYAAPGKGHNIHGTDLVEDIGGKSNPLDSEVNEDGIATGLSFRNQADLMRNYGALLESMNDPAVTPTDRMHWYKQQLERELGRRELGADPEVLQKNAPWNANAHPDDDEPQSTGFEDRHVDGDNAPSQPDQGMAFTGPTPSSNWGEKKEGLDGAGTDWSPDEEHAVGGPTPTSNWGENNDAIDGTTTDWSGQEESSDGVSNVTISPRDATLGPAPTYSLSETVVAVGGASLFGNVFEQALELEGTAELTAFDVLNDTIQSNVSATFDNDVFTEGFDDFGGDLTKSIHGAGIGLVAGELADSLGFEGTSFGDQLGSALTEQALSHGFSAVFDSSIDFWSGFSASSTGMNVASLGAGIVANELTADLGLAAETATGAMLSSVGSTVGATIGSVIPLVGTAIGSVIGSALGGAIGDLFGSDPPPPPEAEATLGVDEHGRLFVESATDKHGGNAGSMSVAAQRAADTINDLVDATGGRLLDPSDMRGIEIGYDGDGVYAGNRRFDSVADAIDHIVETRLEKTAIEGGDVYAKRALYRQLEDGFDMAKMVEALETAEAHGHYQQRAAEIERLADDEAVADELAAYRSGELNRNDLGAAATLVIAAQETAAAAESLGLDRAHRFDEVGRLNDALERAGIDLDGVEVTDLELGNLHGELVVAIRDPERPDASIRDLPHATVDAYAHDFDAAMLYLPDGGAWNLQDLLDLAGVEAGGGAVVVEQALIERYAANADALQMGSAADDVVRGSAADEAVIGWQGSDILRAGAGDDILIGGAGHDSLHGGAGQDTADYSASGEGVAIDLATGEGRGGDAEGDTLHDIEHVVGSGQGDRLAGDAAANELSGAAGDDTLLGGAGSDALHGGFGDDRLDGGAGDDRLAGHRGDDVLAGGTGQDRLSGGDGRDQLAGGAGDDFVMAGSGDDRASGGDGDDTIHGGAGDDLLAGDAGTDTLLGGGGDDTLLAGGDGDTLIGGAGRDTVAYEHDLADYRVELADGGLHVGLRSDLRFGDGEASDRLIDVETLQFGDRTVAVETLRDYLSILEQADEEERERRISGVSKSGTTAIGDAAAIGLVAGFAAPAIAAEQRRTQQADVERAVIESGDRLDLSLPPGTAAQGLLADLIADGGGVIEASPPIGGHGGGGDGGGYAIVPGANPGGAVSAGGIVVPVPLPDIDPASIPPVVDPRDDEQAEAPDSAPESPAADTAAAEDRSGPGLDPIDDEEGAFFLVGTPGADELVDERQLDRIYGRAGDDLILGLDGDDRIFGEAGDDLILPGTGSNRIDGGAGFDTVSYREAEAGVGVNLRAGIGTLGMAADDQYTGIEAAEGSRYADSLMSGDVDSALYGLGGDDSLIGGAGSDTLVGGAGLDSFIGGGGNDTLVIDGDDDLGFVDGGTGIDTVRFGEALGRTAELDRLDGVENVIGSAASDTFRGGWRLDRIDGGAGHDVTLLDANIRDVVTFDPATRQIQGIEWRAGGEALHLAPGGNRGVTIETEEIHFDGHAIYLDGRDNAPITAGETLQGTEDEVLEFTADDLIGNDFDIDPGDTVELLSVGGIDIGLTRALSGDYWDETSAPEFIDPATGQLRTASYGSYLRRTPKGGQDETINLGPRPGDRVDGGDGNDVLYGQVLTEYSGVQFRFSNNGPDTRTFHDSDRLFGHGGDDLLVPGGGGDRVVGGEGNDTVDYSTSGNFVEVDLLGKTGSKGHANGDVLLGIENVIGSKHDDRLHGDNAANVLQGGRGNDALEGRGGNDVLIGGGGRWDAAVFSGDRTEYAISAAGDHLRVEHLAGGADGVDRLYGIQELRFADRSVHIDHARADQGEIRVTRNGMEFAPDPDFNSADEAIAGFSYAVGRADGARASERASIDVAPVNDAPYLLPGEADYDGELYSVVYSPNPKGDPGDQGSYWAVDASGQILGRDLEDGANLIYELVEAPGYGRINVNSDGSFRYRLNVDDDAHSVRQQWVEQCVPREGCNQVPVFRVTPAEDEGVSTHGARFVSFDVAITDHGDGNDEPHTIIKTVDIENDKPKDDDDCFPVALDLGDDGLDFRSVDDSDLLADVNADGIEDRMAWIGAEDGVLMLDRDGDGAFSRPDEISFVDDHPDARTDMEGLALAFDSNADGLLDAADDRWSEFHVWQDADGNGISNPGELRTLEEAGITSIGVISDGKQELAADGDVTIFGRSAFTREDGSVGVAGDVALRYQSVADQPPSNDELAAMMVQRFAQTRSLQEVDSPMGGAIPVDGAALAAAMSESDEFEISNVAG